MAIIKAINSRSNLGAAIKYVSNENKTKGLVSGINCDSGNAASDMILTKQIWEKTEGRQYKHYVQSFHSWEKLTAEKAHEVAKEFAEKRFSGYEVLIATHQDKNNYHTHFIVNSVNFENGKKYQESAKDLQALKDHSDEICLKHGLHIERKLKHDIPTTWTNKKHHAIKKENSYLVKMFHAVKEAKRDAENRADFIKILGEKKIKVDWQDNHKYVVFIDENGKKARDKNLEKTFKGSFSKEAFEKEFRIRFQKELYNDIMYNRNRMPRQTEDDFAFAYRIDEVGRRLMKSDSATQHVLKGFFNSNVGEKLLRNQTIKQTEKFIDVANFCCGGNKDFLKSLTTEETESIREIFREGSKAKTIFDEFTYKAPTEEARKQKTETATKKHGQNSGYHM